MSLNRRSNMPIADGFEVWLRRLDEELATTQPVKTHQDFDALALFKNYENGILASEFAANPESPVKAKLPRKWRAGAPSSAAKPIYWHIVGILVIFFSIYAFQEIGMKGFIEGLDDSQAASETLRASIQKLPQRNAQRIKLEQKLVDTHSHELDGIERLVMYTYFPIRIIWVAAVLMLAGTMNRYLALNYRRRLRTLNMFSRIGLSPRIRIYPDV